MVSNDTAAAAVPNSHPAVSDVLASLDVQAPI
jgi:hypothetical protein